MRRRDLLASLGLAGLGGLAGCLGSAGSGSPPGSPTVTPTPTPRSVTTGFGAVDLPVNGSEIETRLPKDGIPAVTEPAFGDDWGDWLAVDEEHRPDEPLSLDDRAPVVGVEGEAVASTERGESPAERDGEARAYPMRILDHHEVVNDSFGGPLLVTYCPLCGSAVVAVREVRNEETTFGVSGKLWRNDLVLYDDATGSLWSQLLATAIQGPATGETLELVPASLSTWGEWRESHPETRVLLPPPGSVTVDGRDPWIDYDRSKYSYEGESQVVGYDSAASYTLVVGVVHGGEAVAYPFEAVRAAGVVNDRVGDLPVVVAATAGGSLVAYERVVDGGNLRFSVADDRHLRAGGSYWERTTGRAVDGPHEGTRLSRANERSPLFRRAWEDFHPGSRLWSPSE
ncbi:MAG: DUF3179 domain-containing protein [Haloarculaceae archaeon]